jgi:glucose/arabinose dehydrogenase
MKTLITIVKVCVIILILGLVAAGIIFWPQLKGVIPAIQRPVGDITELIEEKNASEAGQNNTDYPLTLPDGFDISVAAKGLNGVRVMAFDDRGNLWVSQTSEGVVTRLRVNTSTGDFDLKEDVFTGLRKPHGLAFDYRDYSKLYIAEEHRVVVADLSAGSVIQKIADLPTEGGGHSTRTIEFGPDGRLYVSIGSSCNVCNESDERRSAIYSMNADGSDFKQFARGLRNAVFFDWSYVDGRMWATEMGRDFLGNNSPPDELNVIQEGANYGWPYCYGKNVRDTNFGGTQGDNPCVEPAFMPSTVDLQAHSAPLGLAFVPEEGWPEDMWYNLIVAYHGSWNRTEPTGYKLVKIKLDAQGNYSGTEDFITGWLTPDGVLGRPVDVLIQPGGVMYVSDDKAGVVYKITYQNP